MPRRSQGSHRPPSLLYSSTSDKKELPLLTLDFKTHRDTLPPLKEEEITLYQKHFALLQEWNEKIALVSRKSIGFSFGNHYADSIWINDFARKHWTKGMVHDLGSGAGFPGYLFAIRYPDIRVTLYERIQKKKKFLEAVQEALNLPNIRIEGDFPTQVEGLVLARAVMPKEELFPFLEKRMQRNSTVIVNSGGQSEEFYPLKYYKRTSQSEYTLPLDCGSRKIEAFTRL